jgi:hypothetical protein
MLCRLVDRVAVMSVTSSVLLFVFVLILVDLNFDASREEFQSNSLKIP